MPVAENPDTRNKLGINLQITSPDKFFSEVYLKNIDTLTRLSEIPIKVQYNHL